MGLTRSAVIEVAIREFAKQQGLPGGHSTRQEIETKWATFMEEDEQTRSAEHEKNRAEAEENTPK